MQALAEPKLVTASVPFGDRKTRRNISGGNVLRMPVNVAIAGLPDKKIRGEWLQRRPRQAAKFRPESTPRPLFRDISRIRASRYAMIVFGDIAKRLLDVVGHTLATDAMADHREKQNERIASHS